MNHQNYMVQSVCKMVINSLFFIQLCNFVDRGVKVRKFQNGFMKSSFLPKYEPKIIRISSLQYDTVQGSSYSGRNNDFINQFGNLLTFSEVRSAFCRFFCSSASQMTKVKQVFMCVIFFPLHSMNFLIARMCELIPKMLNICF